MSSAEIHVVLPRKTEWFWKILNSSKVYERMLNWYLGPIPLSALKYYEPIIGVNKWEVANFHYFFRSFLLAPTTLAIVLKVNHIWFLCWYSIRSLCTQKFVNIRLLFAELLAIELCTRFFCLTIAMYVSFWRSFILRQFISSVVS